ncbi:MAG: ABC transporter ATP-binding protein [Sarcina sp.]
MSIITLENISKIYGKSENIEKVLKNINLSIVEGESLAIIGPSGSGKSTLLNIIGLMDIATSGSYSLYSKNIKLQSEKELANLRNEKFGFIFQNFNLIENYNLIENVIIPLSYSKNKKQMKARAMEMLTKVGLKDHLLKKTNKLSGGQKQRVAIARALVNNPSIILADEPTGSLDSENGQLIMDLLLKINKEGKTLILITHDLNIANQCNRILKIQDGRIESLPTSSLKF